MPEDRRFRLQRLVHLLDEYTGFIGDLQADDAAGFMGHFRLEMEVNAEAAALGFEPVFTRSDDYLGGYEWFAQKQEGEAWLSVHRPRGMGLTR